MRESGEERTRDGRSELWPPILPTRYKAITLEEVSLDPEERTCVVEWDKDGSRHHYRVGCDGCYDLCFHNPNQFFPPFLSHQEEAQQDRQLKTMISDVLLPLASTTKALIVCVGLNYCDFSVNVGSVVHALRSRLGPSARVSMLSIAFAHSIYRKSMSGDSGSIAHKLKKVCQSFRYSDAFLKDLRNSVNEDDPFFAKRSLQNYDYIPGISYYIVMEIAFGEGFKGVSNIRMLFCTHSRQRNRPLRLRR